MFKFNDADQLRYFNDFLNDAWIEANKTNAFDYVDHEVIIKGVYKAFMYCEKVYHLGVSGYELSGMSAEIYNEYRVGGMLDMQLFAIQEIGIQGIIRLGSTDKQIKPTIQL